MHGPTLNIEDPAKRKRLKVGFVLARSFTLTAFSLFVDTLRLASDEEDFSGRKYLDWDVLSDSSQLIKSSCGIFVAPTAGLSRRETYDYIVVVGGLLNVEQPLNNTQIEFIKNSVAQSQPVIGLCTASFILADAGLLKRKTACVSWLHRQDFEMRFPEVEVVSDKLFLHDNGITTCAGGSAAADLASHIVQKHLGVSQASKALQILQIERRRNGSDLQARIPIGKIAPKNIRVRKALSIIEQVLDEKWDIEWLASKLCVTRRHLERLFKKEFGTGPRTIGKWMRLERARVLLVNTEQPISQIAFEVGYDTQSQFSRQFRDQFGTSPANIRASARSTE